MPLGTNSSLSSDTRHPTISRAISVVPNNNSTADVGPDALSNLNTEEISVYLYSINSPISLSNSIHSDYRQSYSTGLYSNPIPSPVVSSTNSSRHDFPYASATVGNPYLPGLSASNISLEGVGLPPLQATSHFIIIGGGDVLSPFSKCAYT